MRIMLAISLGILLPILVHDSTVFTSFSVGANFELFSFFSGLMGGKNFVYSTLDEVSNFRVVFFYE